MNVVGFNSKSIEHLKEKLKEIDILSLHCPLTEETKHLIGKNELQAMKKNAILINTARGPVVDENALLSHLKANPEFYAGLDVFEFEPMIEPSLYQLENCLCLPHIGSATHKTRLAMAKICIDEAVRFSKNEPLINEFKL